MSAGVDYLKRVAARLRRRAAELAFAARDSGLPDAETRPEREAVGGALLRVSRARREAEKVREVRRQPEGIGTFWCGPQGSWPPVPDASDGDETPPDHERFNEDDYREER